MNYNTKQQAFIDCPATRIILHAPPGSGKSHSLIGRIKADQARGIKAADQVCITYTVAAAENLVDRMGGSPPAFVGTIHGYCLKLVRQHWKELGYSQAPSVLDEDESKKELADIAERIGCKNGFEDWRGQELGKTAAQIAARQHLRMLRKRGLCDFVTMQHEALRLVERGVVAPLGSLYVDEGQDVSSLECQIYNELEAELKIICGDEDQNIFSWRDGNAGASALVGGESAWHLDLDINHRSDHRIIQSANRIIEQFNHYRSVNRINRPHLETASEGLVVAEAQSSVAERNNYALLLAGAKLTAGESVAILCRYNADVNMLRGMCSPAMQAMLPQQHADGKTQDHRIAKRVLEFLAGGEECEITAGKERFTTWEPASAIRYFDLTARQIRICEYALSRSTGKKRDALSAYLAMGEQEEASTKFHIGTIHCSPPDEEVLTTRGYVRMDKLIKGFHKIISYNPKCNSITRGKNSPMNRGVGFGFEMSKRPFNGELVVIETESSKTRVTPNHVVRTRFRECFYNKWIVYLMRKGNSWRIGLCTSARIKPYISGGLPGRLATESADDGWILGVFTTRNEAMIRESFLQTFYGIPPVVFTPQSKRNSGLTKVHSLMEPFIQERADKILKDFGLMQEHPMYSRNGVKSRMHGAWFDTEACNLIDGYMDSPVYIERKWETMQKPISLPAKISRQKYKGDVYGLDVPPFHYYISGGNVVHNSAKGKEWDSVIVCGCEEPTWEGKRDSDEDELRRLFYVATTRPRHNLWYVSADHMLNDKTGTIEAVKTSKFVLEAMGG